MPSFAMLKVDNKLKITFPFFSQTEVAVVLVVVVVVNVVVVVVVKKEIPQL